MHGKNIVESRKILNAISNIKRCADVLASFADLDLACHLLFHFNFEAK